ncbi:hypothetical protein ACFX15_039899 [Malus domestica]|uniref:3-phosphoshikimate 1-carboxyvinyltransferase, chloroplastic-like n=1 Tax=Malus sylvestris TaxID=3752 RepID=UPI0021ACF2D7|nr:3-phosphoshikimate 1-carboxyvinyltransferase, chloroplastic-like [Malus sylvestris]
MLDFFSSLLMVAPLALGNIEIEIMVAPLVSGPFVEMTVTVMKRFGVTAQHSDTCLDFFSSEEVKSTCYSIYSRTTVKFAQVLEKMGAKVNWTENIVTVAGPQRHSSTSS